MKSETTNMKYQIKNKRIDHISNIISKRHGILTESVIIFFSSARKTVNVPEFELDKL